MRWPELAAPAVGCLPDVVTLAELPPSSDLAHVILGIGGNDLVPLSVDLTEGHLLISGARRSGRSGALVALVRALRLVEPAPDLRVMAPRRSPLHTLEQGQRVASDTTSCTSVMVELAATVSSRARGAANTTVIAIVDDAGDLTPARPGLLHPRRLGHIAPDRLRRCCAGRRQRLGFPSSKSLTNTD